MRPNEEGLSVNWIEYYDGDWQTKIQHSVDAIRRSFERIGKKSAFGVGNVGKIKETCLKAGVRVRIVYDPTDNNPAHATIRRLPRDDLTLLQALADDAFVDLMRNADIP